MRCILKDLESPTLAANSVSDHVHILLNLHRTKALADVVMEVKRGTSKWIKTKGPQFALSQWQAGYGAFSVSQSAVAGVEEYIRKQAPIRLSDFP
jgi:REP element-mobilizing transposase RayT